jgi:hypothetical protein
MWLLVLQDHFVLTHLTIPKPVFSVPSKFLGHGGTVTDPKDTDVV